MKNKNVYQVSDEIEFKLPGEISWDTLDEEIIPYYNGIIIPTKEIDDYLFNDYLKNGKYFVTLSKTFENNLVNKKTEDINKILHEKMKEYFSEITDSSSVKKQYYKSLFLSNDYAIGIYFDPISGDIDGLYNIELFIEIISETNTETIYNFRIFTNLVEGSDYIKELSILYSIANSIFIDGKKVELSLSVDDVISEYLDFFNRSKEYSALLKDSSELF